jgi:BirA family biotin operon repressor/biotin-[acetyl-CoA-carboxylase] ligase
VPLRNAGVPRHDARAEKAVSTGSPAQVETFGVAETGSTNADLLAWVRHAGAAFTPRLLVADRQTAGRGRHGKAWHATAGASLTFSLAWPLARAELSGLSLAVGVALAEAIDPRPAEALRVGLKWPNDLWLVGTGEPGRKLGGVLIETAPHGSARAAVIGVGLNVSEQRVADAASGVAWLREIDAEATPVRLLERLVPALADALQTFERDGFAAFATRFAARDLLRGLLVHCSVGNGTGLEGFAAGVSPTGELLVRSEAGIERVSSGEVSVRLGARGDAPAGQHPAARSAC